MEPDETTVRLQRFKGIQFAGSFLVLVFLTHFKITRDEECTEVILSLSAF